jgi:hypothetical protein
VYLQVTGVPCSRGSSVSTVTRLRPGRPRNSGRFLADAKYFACSETSRPALDRTQSPIQLEPWALSQGAKRSGRGADHSPSTVPHMHSYPAPRLCPVSWYRLCSCTQTCGDKTRKNMSEAFFSTNQQMHSKLHGFTITYHRSVITGHIRRCIKKPWAPLKFGHAALIYFHRMKS